jgi:uncharacterized OB-fold protein
MDFPLPDIRHDALKPFWDAAAERRLVFPRCTACNAFCWYPRPACPECGSEVFAWTEVAGKARLFSWAVVRRALHPPLKPIVPYVPVILEFDEAPGVRLVSRWIGSDAARLEIGMEVDIVFTDLGHPGVKTGILAALARERIL